VNRAVSRELFGMNGQLQLTNDAALQDALLDTMARAGIGWDREWFYMDAVEGDTTKDDVWPHRGIFTWNYWDAFILKAHNADVHILAGLTAPADWASSDTWLADTSDHGVLNNYRPGISMHR